MNWLTFYRKLAKF